jgi:hypothetical protein
MQAFPQPGILVVVDAPTPEFAEEASNKLAHALTGRTDLIRGVHQLDSGPFFERNGLLFLSTEEVVRITGGLTQAKPLVQTLSTDPSLRGSLNTLSFGWMAAGVLKLDDLTWPMTLAADTAAAVLDGRPASFSWRALASGKPAEQHELRRFIAVEPVLDYSALEPGRAATDAIKKTAQDLKLDSDYQAPVRQTGLVRSMTMNSPASGRMRASIYPCRFWECSWFCCWLCVGGGSFSRSPFAFSPAWQCRWLSASSWSVP